MDDHTPAESDQPANEQSRAGKISEPDDRAEATQDNPPSFSGTKAAVAGLISALGHDIRSASRRIAIWSKRSAAAAKTKFSRTSSPDGNAEPAENIPAKTRLASVGAATFAAATATFGRLGRIRPPKLRSWRGAFFATVLTGFVVVTGVLIWALKDVPWREIAAGSLKPIVVLETANGAPLVRQGPYQGPYATYDQFPPNLINAVLSIEDRRFMEHHGIDLQGIARALLRNIQAGSVVQGGSTITQQLIKLQYLDSDRTLKRKIQEFVIAFWLEWKLGKEEILTRYLNSAYLGAGATGMPAAARIYFNKDIRALNLPESAMLAGLLRAPSAWNPIDNFEGARQRTSVVLDTMVANEKISKDEAENARASFAKPRPTTPTPRSGSWFADWVSPQASEIAGASPGSTTVRTTLVPRLQQIAERIVKNALDGEGKSVGASQAALVAMTPDGAVVAMVGGRDYRQSQFNRAVTAMRQPGSTFKLFVYYAALKAGLTLSDRILDAPIEIDGWAPENSGGGYRGWVTLAEAFARSLNAATVALAQEVGIDKVVAAARELGITAPLASTPSVALGTSEVNLLNLTSAYAAVHAGRAPVTPWGIIDFKAAGQPKAFRVGSQSQPNVDLSMYQSDLLGLLQMVVERGTGREADPGAFAAAASCLSAGFCRTAPCSREAASCSRPPVAAD